MKKLLIPLFSLLIALFLSSCRAAADVGDPDHHDSLLIGSFFPQREKGTRPGALISLSFFRRSSFRALRFLFFRLADYRRDGLQFFAFAQIH